MSEKKKRPGWRADLDRLVAETGGTENDRLLLEACDASDRETGQTDAAFRAARYNDMGIYYCPECERIYDGTDAKEREHEFDYNPTCPISDEHDAYGVGGCEACGAPIAARSGEYGDADAYCPACITKHVRAWIDRRLGRAGSSNA